MRDLKEKSVDDLKIICRENGLADFKAREIFSFIHQKLGVDLKKITTLKKEERERLGQDFYVSTISPLKTLKSRSTEKVLFELEDHQTIETVMMRHEEGRLTLCISCQTGCPIGCMFCATGTLGPGRNLTVSEILSQVYHFAKKDKVSNVLFMGMGEPFLNYDNVLRAARIFNHKLGLNIAARSIVFSTIGILSGIKKLAQEKEADEFKELTEKIVKSLGDKVKEVRVTHRLTDSPACLVVEEHDLSGNLARMLKAAGQNAPVSQPILEINPQHPVVLRLKSEEKRFDDWAAVLFDQALLAEGGQLDDPATFVKRVNQLMMEMGS